MHINRNFNKTKPNSNKSRNKILLFLLLYSLFLPKILSSLRKRKRMCHSDMHLQREDTIEKDTERVSKEAISMRNRKEGQAEETTIRIRDNKTTNKAKSLLNTRTIGDRKRIEEGAKDD